MRAFPTILVTVLLASFPLALHAQTITLNHIDTFTPGGDTQGWQQGGASPNPVVVIDNGGPNGAGDAYILNTSTGVGSSGSKQVMFNQSQWTGNYLTAGVNRITMDFLNVGGTDVSMRIALRSFTTGFASTNGFAVPNDGQWHHAVFDLTTAAMTKVGGLGGLSDTLNNVFDARILSSTVPSFTGDAIAAQIGVDNILATTIPVPTFTWNGAADQTTWDTSHGNFTDGTNTVAFTNGTPVVFNDAAPANATTISIPAAVSPSSVSVNSSTNNFTFQGNGGITGSASLTKSGGSTLTILTNNGYTGTTMISAGTIQVGNGGTTGTLGSGPILNNATLAFKRSDTVILTNTLSGNGNGTLQQLGTGTLLLAQGGAGATIAGNATVSGGGTLATDGSTPLTIGGTLTVNSGSDASFLASASRLTHSVNTLSLSPNANLDLNNHELLTNTAAATIKSYLAQAYDPNGNADWGQRGLTSSVATANPTSFSVGYAFGGDQSAQDAAIMTKGGTPLGANQTIARTVLTGDANMDGRVDFFDITQILGYKYNTGQPASYTDGDLDYNGHVDFFDIVLLLSANYNSGQTYLGDTPPGAAAAAAVLPEPANLLLCTLVATTLLVRRRRSRRQPRSGERP
jgi:autotransporter-associated beta strand protein